MARRRIGQEQLALGRDQLRGTSPLDEVAALVHWAELDRVLVGISAPSQGCAGLAAVGAVPGAVARGLA